MYPVMTDALIQERYRELSRAVYPYRAAPRRREGRRRQAGILRRPIWLAAAFVAGWLSHALVA